MPTFQQYEPQVTPDIGSTPQVRTGAEAIGQGVSNLGAGLQEAATGLAHLQRERDQQQKYDTGLSFDDLRQQIANQRQTLLQNTQGNADGLADKGLTGFMDSTSKWLATVPKPLVPEYAQRILTLHDYYKGQYADDQHQARGQYELATNGAEVVKDQNTVAAEPGAVQHVLENRFAQIDNMSVSPAQKELLKQQAQKALATTYLDAQHGTDPAGASGALGVHLPGGPAPGASGYGATNAPYKAPLDKPGEGGALAPRQLFGFLKSQGASDNEALLLTGAAGSESSFNPNAVHDGGNGHGLFGHNDHRLDMRGKDWEQQASAALQELRSRPEIALVNGAKSPEDLAVAEMHFENPRGYTRDNPKAGDNYTGRLNTIRYFSQMTGQTPTGGPAAAGAHPQDVAYREDTHPTFTQPANPIFSVFSPEERQSMLEQVQQNQNQQRVADTQAASQQRLALVNDLSTGIINNKTTQTDLKMALDNGRIQAAEYNTLNDQLDKQNKTVNLAGRFWSATQADGPGINPYNKDDLAAADAAFQQGGGDLATLDKVYSAAHIVPPSGVAILRGALASNDPGRIGSALTIAANAISRNPNAFTGVDGGKEIEAPALAYSHYVNDLQMPAAQAVQKIAQQNTPEYKSKLPPDSQIEDFAKAITPDTVAKQFSGWLPGSTPKFGGGADQQSEMLRDYRESAVEAFKSNGGDSALAQKQAYADVNKVWGVTNVLGTQSLVKYPIEKTYPPVNEDPSGPYAYILDQASRKLRDEAGQQVLGKDIILAPIPGVTAQAYLKGENPPYILGYQTPDENGFMTIHMLPGMFTPSAEEGHRQAKQFIAPQIDQMNADQAERQQYLNTIDKLKPQMFYNPVVAPDLRTQFTGGEPANPPAIKPDVPSSGSEAFQEQKKKFEEGPGAAFFGSSGAGM